MEGNKCSNFEQGLCPLAKHGKLIKDPTTPGNYYRQIACKVKIVGQSYNILPKVVAEMSRHFYFRIEKRRIHNYLVKPTRGKVVLDKSA